VLTRNVLARCRALAGAVYDSLPFKARLLPVLRPLRLPESVYRHLHFHGTITVPTPGRPIRMQHVAEEIENELFWEGLPGRRERVSMSLWMRLCPAARCIVDVGANSGIYALVARALNPHAPVLAFEPLPDLHARLVGNAELSRFEILAPRVALSDRSGSASMSGWTIGGPGPSTAEVPTARLDELMAERGLPPPDLLKIDVEGHEPAVLRGMGDLLQERPTLLLEVLTEQASAQLEPLVQDLGYLVFDLDEEQPPRRVPRLCPSSKWNLLLCQPDVAARLELS
jgi:FkbM family methyltransferase